MNSAPVAWSSLLILLIGGCQQHSNSAIPLSPISPLGANTRVPPPQTGSYAVPNGYYQGQASVAPAMGAQFAAGVAPTGGLRANDLRANDLMSGDLVANETPVLNGWSDATVEASPSPVQPAAYQNEGYQNGGYQNAGGSAVVSHGTTFGAGSAPRIPASALQPSATAGTPLRPNLGGMDVVDLTSPEPLQPTDPPSLQEIDHGQMRTASTYVSGSAAPTFRSLSPAEAGGTQTAIVQASAVGIPSSAPSRTTASAVAPPLDGEQERPSTSKTDRGTTNTTADLPWRKPTR